MHNRLWWTTLTFISLISYIILFLIVGTDVASYIRFRNVTDYLYDADPAILSLASGNLNFWTDGGHSPLMLPATIIIRALAVFFVEIFTNIDNKERYIIGILALYVPATVGLSWVTTNILEIKSKLKQVMIVVLWSLGLVLLPPAASAINFGHPEEVFGVAALIVGLYAASKEKWFTAAILAAIVVTTKQNFILFAPLFLFILPKQQIIKFVFVSAGITAVVITTAIIPDVEGFIEIQSMLSGQSGTETSGTKPSWYSLLSSDNILYHYSRIIMVTIIALFYLLIVKINKIKLSFEKTLLVLAIIGLIRVIFDPVVNDYYHIPVIVALLLLETKFAVSNRASIYKVLPLPILTIIWSFFIWQTAGLQNAGGILRPFFETDQTYILPLMYLGFTIIPLIALIITLFKGLEKTWQLRRPLVYANTIIIMVAVGLSFTGGPPPITITAPQGFYGNKLLLTQKAKTEPLYYLGEGAHYYTIPVPLYESDIRSWIVYTNIPKEAVPAPDKQFIEGSPPHITVITKNSGTDKIRKKIENCDKNNNDKANKIDANNDNNKTGANNDNKETNECSSERYKVIETKSHGKALIEIDGESTWNATLVPLDNKDVVVTIIGINVYSTRDIVTQTVNQLKRVE